MNRSTPKTLLPVFLLLFMTGLIVACGNSELEQALQSAEAQVAALATENAEAVNQASSQIEAAATENALAINAAATAAAEALSSAQAAVEGEASKAINAAQATAEALTANATIAAAAASPIDYDTETYGFIDEIDLNGVTVKWWHQHYGDPADELVTLIDEFNATNRYGIVVEATNEGNSNDIYDKMISGLTTGDIPSLVIAYPNQAAAYQVVDGLVGLDPYINHPTYGLTHEETSDFFSAFLNADRLPQFSDQSFGFPPNRSMELLYYNQTWLEELGYDNPPRTPTEFKEMACAATDLNAGKVGYQISTDASRVASLIFASDSDIYNYDANQFTYNTREAVEILTLIQDMYTEGCAILISERYGDQVDFGDGKTLFTIGSSSGLPFYKAEVEDSAAELAEDPFDWSVAPIPYTGYEPVQNIYGASVSIPRTSPEEQLAAWLFIKYYTSTEVQARWATVSNYFPVRGSVVDELGTYIDDNPAYGAAFELLQYGKTEAPVAGYDNVRGEVAKAYGRILEGEDVATVLVELDEAANEILAESAP